MSAPRQLAALDNAFLSAESARTPLHVGSVSVFDGRAWRDRNGHLRLADLQRLVDSRLVLVPRFRQHLRTVPGGLTLPWWVDDPRFDVTNHVREVSLDPLGTRQQLYELTCRLHMDLLDRRRPLWELWMVDGLAGGRVAMIEKVHHSLIDGIAGIDVATALMDLTPETGPSPPAAAPSGGGAFRALARRAAATGESWLGAARHPAATITGATSMAKAAASLVSEGALAPLTSLNRSIGSRRRLEGVTCDLPELKLRTRALGVTVNDAVLAAVTGSLRKLFLARGEVPNDRFKVLVPVSTRVERGPGELGNQVAAIVSPLPLTTAEPSARLAAVHASMSRLKGSGQPMLTGSLSGAANWLPAPVGAAAARLVHRQPFANLVVTNVPGVQVPLYLMGAELEQSIPIVPLAANLDLSIGVMSYQDQLTFGLYADEELVPELDSFATWLAASVEEIQGLAVPRGRAPARARGA